ncbi:MAG TPA: sigma-70 family RNA polymerase sigma factor [Tepidisphaeraceae bacterium]|nr:sigma-70 family RNA polymerase sigma factor [Tepidisphaeraceae bacterium]
MSTMAIDHPPPQQQQQNDAELVIASRNGDRQAFGQIVRRYQAMITGLIYASCGDLHRSEDVAQETFISAWKSLSGLRDPLRLPAWLCQIARHRLLDSGRAEYREASHFDRTLHKDHQATVATPQQQLLSEEERELLWRTLREIPQPYRETMVLYYRQERSAADVALAMETTEANVRQRLARGREMLREQVAAMLERNIARSAPNVMFTSAIVASLPALIPSASAASVVGATAAKGTAVIKGGGLAALLAMWTGPILGVIGGLFGTWMSIRNAETPRERRFMIRMSISVLVLVLSATSGLFALSFLQRQYGWSGKTFVLLQSMYWAGCAIALTVAILVCRRLHHRLRREEGLPKMIRRPREAKAVQPLALAGATVGALAWMFGLALRSEDHIAAAVVGTVGAVMMLVGIRYVHGRSAAGVTRYLILHTLVLGLFTFVMLNWRFHAWMASAVSIPLATVHEHVPLWTVNVLLAVLYGFILLTMIVSSRRSEDQRDSSTSAE